MRHDHHDLRGIQMTRLLNFAIGAAPIVVLMGITVFAGAAVFNTNPRWLGLALTFVAGLVSGFWLGWWTGAEAKEKHMRESQE
jgi:hypothetical protein